MTFRCAFVEKDSVAFERLESAISKFPELELTPIHGEFVDSVPRILNTIGTDFSLIFIDPTGWTGFEFIRIAPLLRHHPGEVIINFMYDDINRHVDDPRPEQVASFSELFARTDWRQELVRRQEAGYSREKALVSLFVDGLRRLGNFEYVTFTRILKPLANRTYFYLVYATRHVKGLVEFRDVERKAIKEQEETRYDVKQLDEFQRTGQTQLFAGNELLDTEEALKDQRIHALSYAESILRKLYRERARWLYEEILGHVLEIPLVSELDVGTQVARHKQEGIVNIPELKGRERKPKIGHTIMVVSTSGH